MYWPLTNDSFTFLDRVKLSLFILNKNNFWTRNTQTDLFEKEMAKRVGLKNSPQPIFVSSGSAANTLIAMYWKDTNPDPTRNKIIFPSTTWSTSVSPFIREGFEPIFVDIDPKTLFVDENSLEEVLNREDIYGVFLTTVLGCVDRISIFSIMGLCASKGVRFALDNCESNFSKCFDFCLSTTSTYFSHFVQSCEGGFVFPENESQRDYFLTLMNHGMTRFCSKKPKAPSFVDEKFWFLTLGNNFRNSDLHARVGRLSLKKADKIIKHRTNLLLYFLEQTEKHSPLLIKNIDFLSYMTYGSSVPFCLPLVFDNPVIKQEIERQLNQNGVETRPIISGNLACHNAFEGYRFYPEGCPNSSELSLCGFYVGLNEKITHKHIDYLIQKIKKI